MSDLTKRLRDRANDSAVKLKPFNLLLDAAEEIERLECELLDFRATLKDPAAVRVNFLRGDIACQNLVEEARRRGFEEAVQIIRARMPLYTELQALNACRECISSIEGAVDQAPPPGSS